MEDETEILEQEEQQEEVEATPETPATPTFAMPDDVRESLLAEAEQRAYDRLTREVASRQPPPPPAPEAPNAPKDPVTAAQEEADRMGIIDDRWVTGRALAIQREQIKAELQSEFDSRYGEQITRTRARDAVSSVAGDLGPQAQQYIQQFGQYLDPSWGADHPVRQLFREAAENVDRKSRPTSMAEPVAREPQVRVNESDYAQYNQQWRTPFGLEPLSKADYAALTRN